MVTSGLFNSVNGDRVYNADDLSNFFSGLLNDGIFKNYESDLEVTSPGSVNYVEIGSGKAFFLGKYIRNTGTLQLEVEPGDVSARYDAVCVGVDLEERTADIYIKKGTPATNPAPPAMIRTATKFEAYLAVVIVPAGASTVIPANIFDMRSDQSFCGYVSLTNGATLQMESNDVTASAGESSITIGISSFNSAADKLVVYINGLLLPESYYTLSGTGSAAAIVLNNALSSSIDSVFTFIVYKVEF